MKKILFVFISLLISAGGYYGIKHMTSEGAIEGEKATKAYDSFTTGLAIGNKKDKYARFSWYNDRLRNPQTGKIPSRMGRRELAFAKTLHPNVKAKQAGLEDLEWVQRGPNNIGGRTRAFGVDVNDSNILLAGGISGGIFRSTDAGANWEKVSTINEHQGVVTLVQDTREGYTDNWYYGTGEAYGNSAGDGGAYYFGNGMYKSTDNGLTWQPMGNNSDSPTTFDTEWDVMWRLAVDPSAEGEGEIYAATYDRIYRSDDGGENWSVELGSSTLGSPSYFADVAVTASGVVYATMSSEGQDAGIWRSEDGLNWTEIQPEGLGDVWDRIVIGIDRNFPDQAYFLGVTPNSGKETTNFLYEPERNSFWKYNGESEEWTDLSDNLPIGPYRFDDFNCQGGYDLLVEVKPDDPNVVIIGGTNLYRSTDGFTSMDNTTFIGGYGETTDLPLFELYPNHHPDQHGVTFDPNNPDILYSYHDGGITRVQNIYNEVIEWENLNYGYVTTQFYTVAIDWQGTDNVVIGGLQDNGTRLVDTSSPDDPWVMPFNYDGSFCAIPSHREYMIMSINGGKIVKVKVDAEGFLSEYQRIDPADADPDGYMFINPIAMDPTDNNVLYVPNNNDIWANVNIDIIPFANTFDSTGLNWVQTTIHEEPNTIITAVNTTHQNPSHRVYIGTGKANSQLFAGGGKVYRMDDANGFDPVVTDITTTTLPIGGFVSCMGVNPVDGDEVFVVYSNYEIYSLYRSTDAGESWEKCAGNLEQFSNGGGNGPSLRWINVLPVSEDSTAYYLGTSVGLYATGEINGEDTEWSPVGLDAIGTTVVEMIESRMTDDLIVVGTHGNGVFTANTPADPLPGVEQKPDVISSIQHYPNPLAPAGILNIKFELKKAKRTTLSIYDEIGRLVAKQSYDLQAGAQQLQWQLQDYAKGIYYFSLETDDFKKSKSFIVQ